MATRFFYKHKAVRRLMPDIEAENPIEHTCDVREGQQWISLARGEGNFYDGWMKNPMSAMICCNDGFRPFSFYL